MAAFTYTMVVQDKLTGDIDTRVFIAGSNVIITIEDVFVEIRYIGSTGNTESIEYIPWHMIYSFKGVRK